MSKLLSVLARGFPNYDDRPTYVWARENVRLPASYAKPGPFEVDESRHLKDIFDKLDDEHCREVNYRKPVRSGGSMVGDIWMPRVLATDAGPAMDVFQTDADAADHATEKIIPIFEACPGISIPTDRTKVSQTASGASIEFAPGLTWQANGPALSNLQRISIRYMRLDECWMYPQGTINEAKGRLGDFVRMANYKLLCVSQGGPKEGVRLDESDWNVQFNDAEIYEWEVRCQQCDKYFDPVFTGVRPDGSFYGLVWTHYKLPSGDWDVARCVPTVRFVCPHCGEAFPDGPRTKKAWNESGHYRLTNREYRKKASFHHEAVIDFPWEDLVDLWLKACNAAHRGDLAGKIQFFQKRRALDMDEETLLRGGMNLKRVPYEITGKWTEERVRFLTVDCQKEGVFWWTVRAWSARKSRRIGFGKAFSFAEIAEIAKRFEIPTLLTHKFSRVLIDSRWNTKGPQGVYAACCRFGWVAVQGDKARAFWHSIGKTRQRLERCYSECKFGDPECDIGGRRPKAPLIQFSKSHMNSLVQMLLDAGDWEEPEATPGDEIEAEYAAQMQSRSKRTEFNRKTNAIEVFWREGKNDHARDLANMQVLAAVLNSLLPDPVQERV